MARPEVRRAANQAAHLPARAAQAPVHRGVPRARVFRAHLAAVAMRAATPEVPPLRVAALVILVEPRAGIRALTVQAPVVQAALEFQHPRREVPAVVLRRPVAMLVAARKAKATQVRAVVVAASPVFSRVAAVPAPLAERVAARPVREVPEAPAARRDRPTPARTARRVLQVVVEQVQPVEAATVRPVLQAAVGQARPARAPTAHPVLLVVVERVQPVEAATVRPVPQAAMGQARPAEAPMAPVLPVVARQAQPVQETAVRQDLLVAVARDR